MLMHESERRGELLLNGEPIPDDALARILGLDVAKLKQTSSKTLPLLLLLLLLLLLKKLLRALLRLWITQRAKSLLKPGSFRP